MSLEGGQLNPNLSFFGGSWDAVVILVEGCGSFVGGRGCFGVWRSEVEFPS